MKEWLGGKGWLIRVKLGGKMGGGGSGIVVVGRVGCG